MELIEDIITGLVLLACVLGFAALIVCIPLACLGVVSW